MIYDVIARVVKQTGTCPAGHKVGDEVVFSQNQVQGKVCFNALSAMMGCVLAMRYGCEFPWETTAWACPDHKNPVVFEMTRRREDSKDKNRME